MFHRTVGETLFGQHGPDAIAYVGTVSKKCIGVEYTLGREEYTLGREECTLGREEYVHLGQKGVHMENRGVHIGLRGVHSGPSVGMVA